MLALTWAFSLKKAWVCLKKVWTCGEASSLRSLESAALQDLAGQLEHIKVC